jgi:hypothetical protein
MVSELEEGFVFVAVDVCGRFGAGEGNHFQEGKRTLSVFGVDEEADLVAEVPAYFAFGGDGIFKLGGNHVEKIDFCF